MIKKLNVNAEFLKYIVVLMSGTMIAQLVSYLFAPIITRLYTPEEAAELGLFLRIISVGAAIATARYENALPILKADVHSFRLYRVAIRLTTIVSIVAVLILIIPFVFEENLYSYVFYALVPVGIFLTAVFNLGTNWSIRLKKFKSITYSRVSNSIITNAAKVVFGFMHVGYTGLIFSTIGGLILANIWFIKDYFETKKVFKFKLKSPRNYLLAKEYKEFPTINLPHTLMELSKDLVVAVLLLEFYSKEDFGLFDHSYRMLRLPLVFVGLAIGQVFFQRCAEKINNGEDILPMISRAVKTLALMSIIPFTAVFFFGEEMFAFVFGDAWRGAGTYAEIMTPWFMVNFIISPVSTLPLILRRQKDFFKIAIFGTIMMIATITIPYLVYEADIQLTLWIVSISQALFLIFVLYKIFDFVKENNKQELTK